MFFRKVCFVSVSGGKDSALCLALALEKYRGTDVLVVPLFAETLWEHPDTYRYLDQLEDFFGLKIYRVLGIEGGLFSLLEKLRYSPTPRRRFCTQLLKVSPLAEFYKRFYFDFPFELAEVWLGNRRDESVSRRYVDDSFLPAGKKTRFGEVYPFHIYFHYPLKNMSAIRVFEQLYKRRIPLNPLYLKGFNRVGCYPCLLSKRDIIQVILRALDGDEFSALRVEQMRTLEEKLGRRLHPDYSLEELIREAKRKYRLLVKQLAFSF